MITSHDDKAQSDAAPLDSSDVSVLLFDLGQVVLNVRLEHAFSHWARCAGIDPRELAARYHVGDAYAQHEIGALTGQQFFAALREMLGIDIDDRQFEDGWNSVFDGVHGEVHRAIVQARQRRRVYAFSNTNRTHRRRFMALYAAEMAVFERIFDSSEIGLRKPDVAAFDHVVGEIGTPASQILFFDDLPENIDGAARAGLRTQWVRMPSDVLGRLASLR